MTVLRIKEYTDLARDVKGNVILAGKEPAIAEQTVVNTGASTKSAAFNEQTRFVFITTDSICSIKFGSDPTATTSHDRLPVNAERFYGVNGGDKVAAVLNT